MACPLRSTGITPLHHYYETVLPELRIRTLALVVGSKRNVVFDRKKTRAGSGRF
jgi:hypothetical protein